MNLYLNGAANDYVGKGMNGGKNNIKKFEDLTDWKITKMASEN